MIATVEKDTVRQAFAEEIKRLNDTDQRLHSLATSPLRYHSKRIAGYMDERHFENIAKLVANEMWRKLRPACSNCNRASLLMETGHYSDATIFVMECGADAHRGGLCHVDASSTHTMDLRSPRSEYQPDIMRRELNESFGRSGFGGLEERKTIAQQQKKEELELEEIDKMGDSFGSW